MIFAAEMLRIFTRMFVSVLARVFLLPQRTQINGKRSRTDVKNRCLKKGLFKVAHRGIRIAGSGARKMEDNTIEV